MCSHDAEVLMWSESRLSDLRHVGSEWHSDQPQITQAIRAKPSPDHRDAKFPFVLFLLYHAAFLIWNLWTKLYSLTSCGKKIFTRKLFR